MHFCSRQKVGKEESRAEYFSGFRAHFNGGAVVDVDKSLTSTVTFPPSTPITQGACLQVQLLSPPAHVCRKMFARTALRASSATSAVARRGFHSSSTRMASPYHYPEGPRSNIPFNPLTKFFYVRYWSYMGTHTCESARA